MHYPIYADPLQKYRLYILHDRMYLYKINKFQEVSTGVVRGGLRFQWQRAVQSCRERSIFLTDTRYGTRHHLARIRAQEKRGILCTWEVTSMECKVRCPVVVWITVYSNVT